VVLSDVWTEANDEPDPLVEALAGLNLSNRVPIVAVWTPRPVCRDAESLATSAAELFTTARRSACGRRSARLRI